MSINRLVSGKVPVVPYEKLSPDRDKFLSLDQAEPNLGSGGDNTILTFHPDGSRIWANTINVDSATFSGDVTAGNLNTDGNVNAGDTVNTGNLQTSNITSDPNVGNVVITSSNGSNTSSWTFDPNGNITLPSANSAFLYPDGNSILQEVNNAIANIQSQANTILYDLSNVVIPTANGNVYVNSNGTHQWNFDTDGTLTAPGNILPSDDNAQYLGSANKRWHTLFVGPGSLNIDGIAISNTSGELNISSNITANFFNGDGSKLFNIESNKIFNGNSYACIGDTDGNLVISSNGANWVFDSDGGITLPDGGNFYNNTYSWHFAPDGTTLLPGNLYVPGNIVFGGNTSTENTVNLTVNDNIINLNSPDDLSPLAYDSQKDIGFKFHYYNSVISPFGDNHAFLGRAYDSGYLEWYDRGDEVGNEFIGSYGTIKANNYIAMGNVTANYFVGDGGNLSNLNVSSYLTSTTSDINTTGNINASGNITSSSNITTSGSIGSNNISASGNISGTNITGSGNISGTNITGSGNISANNFTVSNNITANGNISANNFTASNNIIASGNITATNFNGNGSNLTGIYRYTTVNANGTALVANTNNSTLNVAAGNNIVITGTTNNQTMNIAVSDNPSFSGNVSVTGNITVNGNTVLTTANIANGLFNRVGANISKINNGNQGAIYYGTLQYQDVNILLSLDTNQNQSIQGAIQNPNPGSSASAQWVVANDLGTAQNNFLKTGTGFGAFGIRSSGSFVASSGNPSYLPSAVYLISNGGDVVIGSETSNYIRFFTNYTRTESFNISNTGVVSVLSNINATSTTSGALVVTGGVGVSGNIHAASFTGNGAGLTNVSASTVTSNAQPNITSVGTLTSLSVTGNISGGNLSVTGNITGNILGTPIGYLYRPIIALSTNATLTANDAGVMYYKSTNGALTLTIPTNNTQAIPVGSEIKVVNQGTGNITLAPTNPVNLYLGGNTTSGSRVIINSGIVTLTKVATNVWFVEGMGII